MWAARYFPNRYFAPRFWPNVGADAPMDVCGNAIGTVVAYSSATGGMADHQAHGWTTAYVTATGDQEECQ